jgi:HK97 family phage portal protein
MSWLGDRVRHAALQWLTQAPAERRSAQQGNGMNWLQNILELLAGPKASSGVHMSERKALTIPAVSTAVRLIGGTVGSMPQDVYRRTEEGGRELALRHWAHPLLHDAPNEYHTAFTWRELLVTHVLLWGNSYNRIEWLQNGTAGALLPLMPWCVEPRLTSGGVKYYTVHLDNGKEDLPDDEVLHVPGVSYDGMRGMSVIERMRDAMGLSKAAEDLAGAFFANGAKVGGILEVPGKMDPEAQKNLVESLQKTLTSKEGAFKAIVLEEGAKFHGPTMMPFKDAQFLELRGYQRAEILAEFGVPPHLGGLSDKQTSWGTGIEQMDIGYAKHTIMPLCARIEMECNRKLFRRGSGYYTKFNLDALMRGDFKSRMEGLQIAVGGPWLTRNEARAVEDWNRSSEEGMDKVLTALNMGAGATPKPPKEEEPKGAPAKQDQ